MRYVIDCAKNLALFAGVVALAASCGVWIWMVVGVLQ